MAQIDESTASMTAALCSFDVLRTELAEQVSTLWRPRRPPNQVIEGREGAMFAEMLGICDALGEVDQLRIYRFFLTAVHRNSIQSHRFDPEILAYPDRIAAVEVELAQVSSDLEEIIDEIARYSPFENVDDARTHATAYMWSMVWWLHARADVTSFRFTLGEDPLVTLLLGREPEESETVVCQIYHCALRAEFDYRKVLMRHKFPQEPMHMRGESHL